MQCLNMDVKFIVIIILEVIAPKYIRNINLIESLQKVIAKNQ